VPFAGLRAQAPQHFVPLPAPIPRPPVIAIAGPVERPVVLQSVKVNAEIAGSVALTRVEMVFFNPNSRVLEGELQFPLLDGQSIVGFALDVDGKLREAVPVEKARGQAVFEDITRVRVDPGLLQVTQGNNFKLRVYPLMPQKTRTVVIRYSEALASAGTQRVYRLPLAYAAALPEFALRVRVAGNGAPKANGGELAFKRAGSEWIGSVERKEFAASGVLEVAVPAARGPLVQTQDFDGRTYFYAELPLAVEKAPRPAPRVVALAWDSSGSGADRDHAKEFALLGAYFSWMKNGEVLLQRVRDTAEPAQRFRIAQGDWRELRRALESTVYDGATNLGALTAPAEAEEVLLFSDGLANFGEGRLEMSGKRVHTVSAAVRSDPGLLRALAETSGGRYIDLLAESPRDAAAKLSQEWARVTAIDADGAVQLVRESAYPQGGRVAVAGVLREPEARLRIELALPGGRTRTVELPVRAARSGAMAAGLWARLRLAELEAEHDFNQAEIKRVGKAFGVVTRETSLIVLERVADYVRHDIVPPAELRAEYEQLMKVAVRRREADRHAHLEQIVRLFQEKQAWWAKDFPKDQPALEPVARDQLVPAQMQMERSARAAPASPMARSEARMAQGAPAAAERARADQPQPGGIAIQLKPWTPDAAYARRLREASAKDVYRVYLDERPGYRASTAFFLDAADVLLEKGQGDLAIRVLSNLAEMDLENRHILRILGYRLMQAGRASTAVAVFRKVLELAPEEPQSWRDLGLALAADKQFQKAVDALNEVVTRPWHGRFPEIELIALAELNAIAATAPGELDLSRVDARLAKNLPLDLRVVLSWDADNTDIDLWVTDPNGEKAFYGHRLTYQGGRMSQDFTGGYGPEEFSLKRAKPGRYKVEAQFYGHNQQIVAGATTLSLKLATYFGTPQQSERNVTLRLAGRSEIVFVSEFEVK
jgi:Flp pilus assembly protein TadD